MIVIEILRIVFIVIMVLTTTTQGQYPCTCNCCLGQSCQPSFISYAYASACTTSSCLQACSNRYYQCVAQSPFGQASGTCTSFFTTAPLSGPYSCRCDCCNLNSSSCLPSLVGYTTAYTCSSEACSIRCSNQYSLLCVSSDTGQTQGTCQGYTTTSTSTTTTGPWLANNCSCYCCQSGPYCTTNVPVGIASSSYCSTYACTLACQAQYPSLCPATSTVGQTNGRCLTSTTGSTQCKCNCCGTNGCNSFNIYTNGECTSCLSLCQQQTQCVNVYQTTYTCDLCSFACERLSFYYVSLLLFFQLTFVRNA